MNDHDRLRAAGWVLDERLTSFEFWTLPGVSSRVVTREALRILDGEICPAQIYHGPGHQSRTRCELSGEHDVHQAHIHRELAQWRTGGYTGKLRAQGIDFDPSSYPETMGMTGFFDEVEEIDE